MTITENYGSVDLEALAKLAYNHALRDILNDVGRIILSDLCIEANMPLEVADVIEALNCYYPDCPVQQRTPNVITVKINRKVALANDRKIGKL